MQFIFQIFLLLALIAVVTAQYPYYGGYYGNGYYGSGYSGGYPGYSYSPFSYYGR
jgi:hypothetical protein